MRHEDVWFEVEGSGEVHLVGYCEPHDLEEVPVVKRTNGVYKQEQVKDIDQEIEETHQEEVKLTKDDIKAVKPIKEIEDDLKDLESEDLEGLDIDNLEGLDIELEKTPEKVQKNHQKTEKKPEILNVKKKIHKKKKNRKKNRKNRHHKN